MQDQDSMNDGLSAFEASLSQLTPAEDLDRDSLMFQAGRASLARGRRQWRLCTAAMCCVAAAAAAWVIVRPPVQVVQVVYVRPQMPQPQVAVIPQPSEHSVQGAAVADEPSRAALSPYSYFNVRRQVLRHGLDALPESGGSRGAAADDAHLLNELMNRRDFSG